MYQISAQSNARLRRMIRKALEAAIPTQPELARAAGISYHALRQYRKGERTPPPQVVKAVARALRKQGGKLQQLAAELEATARAPTRTRRKP